MIPSMAGPRTAPGSGPLCYAASCLAEPVAAPGGICPFAPASGSCVQERSRPRPSRLCPGQGPGSSLSGSSVISFNSSVPSINLTSCKYESGKSQTLQGVPSGQPRTACECPLGQGGALVPDFQCMVTFGFCIYWLQATWAPVKSVEFFTLWTEVLSGLKKQYVQQQCTPSHAFPPCLHSPYIC